MNGAFYIGATGLQAQQRGLEVVANNITNMNTAGYKRREVQFSELVGPAAAADAPAVAAAAAAMLGVSGSASEKLFVQGELKETGSPLDLAISGEGFIELLGPGGQTILWRGGTLQVGEDGFLGAANGMPLRAGISIPADATAVTVARNGEVRATIDGTPELLGTIELVRVGDPAALSEMEGGLYAVNGEGALRVADPDGGTSLVQGFVEQSNVELSREMVALMLMQRAYAASAQIVQAGDQLMGIANSLKR